MKTLGIIPVRYNSKRCPGKALAIINGKTLIQRVHESVERSNVLDNIIVATDCTSIYNHIRSLNYNVMMTDEKHQNGTERCAEAVTRIYNSYVGENLKLNYDYIVNIQGDTIISPEHIDLVLKPFKDNKNCEIATLYKRIKTQYEWNSPNVVKISFNYNRRVIDFSRYSNSFFRHVGVYAYKTEVLREISELSPTTEEMKQPLEQLRWLENGYRIFGQEVTSDSFSVDTPEDLEKLCLRLKD